MRAAVAASAPLSGAVYDPRSGGGNGWIPLAIGGVLVLVIGGAAGLFFRRRLTGADG